MSRDFGGRLFLILSVPALSRFALWPWASYIIFLNLGFLMPALLVVVKIGDDLCEGTGPEKMVHVSSNYCWFQNTLSVFLRVKIVPICFCSFSLNLCV